MPYSLMNGMYFENTDSRHPNDPPGYFMGKPTRKPRKKKEEPVRKKVKNAAKKAAKRK